jgi:hypothetical protein
MPKLLLEDGIVSVSWRLGPIGFVVAAAAIPSLERLRVPFS